MAPDKDTYGELRRKLSALSFDPYILSERDLAKVQKTEAVFSKAIKDGSFEAKLRSLCTDSTERLLACKTASQRTTDKLKECLLLFYRQILDASSRFLALDVFQGTTSTWFFDLSEQDSAAVGQKTVLLLSELERIKSGLIGMRSEEPSPTSLTDRRRDILILRLSVALASDSPPSLYDEWKASVSACISETEAIQEAGKAYRTVALQIAVELIPSFGSEIRPLIFFRDNGAPVLKETSSLRKLLREVQAFRERIRQTAEPLFKA